MTTTTRPSTSLPDPDGEGAEATQGPLVTPDPDQENAQMKTAGQLLREIEMGARNLTLVSDTIELDAPEQGLENTLNDIAHDLQQVGQVRRDVKSWALYGAAASSLVTVATIAGLFFAFMPSAPPPAIVINPAPVAVEFSSNSNPTLPGERRCAAMPEPTTIATRNAVPI